MTDYAFISGFPVQLDEVTVGGQSDISGNEVFINPSYSFFATYPALSLLPINSNVPILARSYGWVNGG